MLGEPVERATTESLLIVAITALVGAVAAARAHRVRVRIALAFAASGAATAVAGTALNRMAGSRVIMLGFALLLLAAAYALVRDGTVGMAGPVDDEKAPAWARVTTAGAATGLLTGLFGVGGGFVIVPALALVLGLPLALAVGTSLLVIALTSTAALAAHLATGSIDLPLSAAFTTAAIAGAVAGTRLHGKIAEPLLRRRFALLLIAVAISVIAKNTGG